MRVCLWFFVVVIVFGFGDGKNADQRLRTERISGAILLSPSRLTLYWNLSCFHFFKVRFYLFLLDFILFCLIVAVAFLRCFSFSLIFQLEVLQDCNIENGGFCAHASTESEWIWT
jgi:hypothetical protein